MWAVRVITGPRAGHIQILKSGRNLIGRSADCDLILNSGGVSKHHCEITVINEKLTAADLKSSNGTFLNGVRIQSGFLHVGDKLSVGEIILDIFVTPRESSMPISTKLDSPDLETSGDPITATKVTNGSEAMTKSQSAPQNRNSIQSPSSKHSKVASRSKMSRQNGERKENGSSYDSSPRTTFHYNEIESRFTDYINRVVLPMVYELFQLFNFRQIILGFSLVFIVGTTLLSVFPMVHLTQEGIMTESRRRAQSLAKALGTLNQNAILQDSMAGLSVGNADSEDGVKTAIIVRQSDGMILAPATRAGVVSDIPFVHSARQEMRPFVKDLDSGTIGASFPVGGFDSNSGEQIVKAHAIILYDVSSIAMDDSRIISLFMQTLVLALLLGAIVFFLMYKVIEYPMFQLNAGLDTAMREKTDNIEIKVLHRPLQDLVSNINSLLTRSMQVEEQSHSGIGGINKHIEAENLARLIGYPCIIISDEGVIIAGNPPFEQIARTTIQKMQGHKISVIPDPALQKNLIELLEKARNFPMAIHSDQIDFSGHNFKISCYGIGATPGKFDYFVISVSPLEGATE